MTASSWLPLSGYLLRRYVAADQVQVLALVEADRLPGQAAASPRALVEALEGRSPAGARWWAQLTDLRTEVLVTTADSGEQVVGVISYARWQDEQAGVLLWLHAREQSEVVLTLIQRALGQLRDCPHIYAYYLGTAFAPELEALAICYRPVTDTALRSLGFTATDLGRYFHRPISFNEHWSFEPLAGTQIACEQSADSASWIVSANQNAHTVGQATICVSDEGTGELRWWLTSDTIVNEVMIGQALLCAALDQLRVAGATEAIVRVPGRVNEDRDWCLAEDFYQSLGFVAVDRLMCFSRYCGDFGVRSPELLRNRDPRERDRPVDDGAADSDVVPLVGMVTAVSTGAQKTFMVDSGGAPGDLTPEVLRMICDALDVIKKHDHR